MATDDVNIAEDADMAECDGDKVVTMMDVLQEQQEFEEDANAVLGASDDKNCTYSKGYIKRQALYACLTCCTEAKVDPTKRAGVCLACSLSCHENHELIELYTKRNFRCDCGNPKFNTHPCQFTTDKTDLNDDNVYNQNFSGLYCTCQRPYPDPDSTIDDDDMIQCIICEDWLHASHLEAVVPANDQYSEMVCKNCMEKNEFLHDYSMFAVTAETGDLDILPVIGDAKSADTSLCNGDSEEKLLNGIEHENENTGNTSGTVNGDDKMDEDKEKSGDEKTVDESAPTEISEEAKQDEPGTTESSESKPEEIEKSNTEDRKMDFDTESKIADQEEQSVETETNKSVKTDAPAEDSNNDDNDKKESSEEAIDKSDDKPDAAENTPTADLDLQNKVSPKKADSNNENEPDKADDKEEETETKEQTSNESIIDEIGDAEIRQENETDTSEQTEQQLLGDITSITADNPTLEEKTDTATEEKPIESKEQSDENKEKDKAETNKDESNQETANDSKDNSEEKPVVDNETKTGNIDVPDTSQPEKDAKENTTENTDSVMDAIDELLQTANAAKQKEEEIKETTIEFTESMKTTDIIEASDVDMSSSENKLDKVPENTEDSAESNDKTITNTEDVEMSDTTTQNEPVGESKDEPQVNENKLENESAVGEDKSKVTDIANESISQENVALNENDDKLNTSNETDGELKTSDNNDSTINSKDENEVTNAAENAKEHKRKLSTDLTDDVSSKKAKLECIRPKEVKRIHKGATFWPSNFRQKLCTCGECLSMYKDLKVLFLTDLEDTVFAYESLGKENIAGGVSQYEKGMQALSSLDRIQQINALTEYNRMRDKLLDFLKSFKDRKEIVKEEDIREFFAGMKPRQEHDGVYFCR